MSDENSTLPDLFAHDDFKPSVLPPPFLYKYMVKERVTDVLEGGMVRFTHLCDTNDTFEVRKTFKRFGGPKLAKLLDRGAASLVTPEFIDREIRKRMSEAGVDLPPALVRELLERQLGIPVEDFIRSQMDGFVKMFVERIDTFKSPEDFLSEIGSTIMCFSLSERYDIATMWAHYAGNHSGLVIEFDTDHAWFKNESNRSETKLQKIKYLDNQNDELLDDLEAAFSSKTTDWASEREWRLNCSMKQIERTVEAGNEKVHLRSFPAEAVVSVIVGYKASSETVGSIGTVLQRKYPWAKLRRAMPVQMQGSFLLEDL